MMFLCKFKNYNKLNCKILLNYKLLFKLKLSTYEQYGFFFNSLQRAEFILKITWNNLRLAVYFANIEWIPFDVVFLFVYMCPVFVVSLPH